MPFLETLQDQSPALIGEFERWAVVIGISEYASNQVKTANDKEKTGEEATEKKQPTDEEPAEDKIPTLKYAHSDAKAFARQLQSPECGSFLPNKMKVLVNETATTRKILSALRSFLKKPAPDDLVIIYISGHGTPDPDRPNNHYFLTYDTDPEDIPGTALNMTEIEKCLKDTLLAERVIVIADTCHSGAVIGGSGRKSAAIVNDEAKLLQRMLDEDIQFTKPGIAWLASSSAAETSLELSGLSQEDEEGAIKEKGLSAAEEPKGYGVFTYYLLQGLRGKAANPVNKKVTVYDLFRYVQDKVEEKTDDKQHPVSNIGDFSVDMPLAYIGGYGAQAHFELGKDIMKIAGRLPVSDLFNAAAWQFREADRYARRIKKEPEYLLALAEAYTAAGKPALAKRALKQVEEENEALFQLGCLHLLQGQPEQAVSQFEKLLERNIEPAGRMYSYSKWKDQSDSKLQPFNLYALVIGINIFQDEKIPPLNACVNDARDIEALLSGPFGELFHQVKRVLLSDGEATKGNILEHLLQIEKTINRDDYFLFFYSGHALQGKTHQDGFLVPHDGKSNQKESFISSMELHKAVSQIRCHSKVVLLDSDPNEAFIALAEQENTDYAALLGADIGCRSEEGLRNGMFTTAFLETLKQWQSSNELGFRGTIEEKILAQGRNQKPRFIREWKFLQEWGLHDSTFELVDFLYGRRRTFPLWKVTSVEKYCTEYFLEQNPWVGKWYSRLAEAFMESGAIKQAIDCWEKTSAPQIGHAKPHLEIGLAYNDLGDFSSSKKEIDTYLDELKSHSETPFKDVTHDAIESLQKAYLQGIGVSKKALLVAIEKEHEEEKNYWYDTLKSMGFKDEDITSLSSPSPEKFEQKFTELAKHAKDQPAFFLFSGIGTIEKNNEGEKLKWSPALLCTAQGEETRHITLNKLNEISQSAKHLICVIEAGFSPTSNRFYLFEDEDSKEKKPSNPPTAYIPSAASYTRLNDDDPSIQKKKFPQLGGNTIYAICSNKEGPNAVGDWREGFSKNFTEVLKDLEYRSLPLSKLLEKLGNDSGFYPVVHQSNPQQTIIDYKWLGREHVKAIRADQLERVKEGLQQLIFRGDRFKELRVDLGVVLAMMGGKHHLEEAIDQLELAIAQDVPNAAYTLGRILVETGEDWNKAVSYLEKAKALEPQNAILSYYLGMALWELNKQEGKKEAQRELKAYLEGGALIGKQQEVNRLLDSLDKEKLQAAALTDGLKLKAEKKYEESIARLKSAIYHSDNTNEKAYTHLGEVFEETGNYVRAVDAYRYAILIKRPETDSEQVQNVLAVKRTAIGNLGKSIYQLITDPNLLYQGLTSVLWKYALNFPGSSSPTQSEYLNPSLDEITKMTALLERLGFPGPLKIRVLFDNESLIRELKEDWYAVLSGSLFHPQLFPLLLLPNSSSLPFHGYALKMSKKNEVAIVLCKKKQAELHAVQIYSSDDWDTSIFKLVCQPVRLRDGHLPNTFLLQILTISRWNWILNWKKQENKKLADNFNWELIYYAQYPDQKEGSAMSFKPDNQDQTECLIDQPVSPDRYQILFRVRVENTSDKTLYAYIFHLGQQFRIKSYLKENKLMPGGTVNSIPDNWRMKRFIIGDNWEEECFYFKLFISETPLDLQTLQQMHLPAPGVSSDRGTTTHAPGIRKELLESLEKVAVTRQIKIRVKNPFFDSSTPDS